MAADYQHSTSIVVWESACKQLIHRTRVAEQAFVGGAKLSEKTKFQVSLLAAFTFGLFLAAYPWEGSASLVSYPV
jgi:hypothetical protein